MADEVVRWALHSGQNEIKGARIVALLQYVRGRTAWILVLHESENPVKFDTCLVAESNTPMEGELQFARQVTSSDSSCEQIYHGVGDSLLHRVSN